MTIFQTSKYALADALEHISESNVRTLAGDTIFKRGRSYHESGAIEDIAYTDIFTIEATVSGSDFYAVTLTCEDGSIDADCDCPYEGGGLCKHVVAVLLEAITEGTNIDGYSAEWDNAKKPKGKPVREIGGVPLTALGKTGQPPHVSSEFRGYVESLSIQELQELVFRYAPQEFRQAVLTRSLGNEDAKKVRNAVQKAINKIFDNEYLRHDNKKLERELLTQIERLRGLWDTLSDDVADILLYIITTFDEGFEEGEFYDGDSDFGFTSKKFDTYVLQFLASIPEESKNTIGKQFYDRLTSVNFGNFDGILKRSKEWYPEGE